MFPFKITIHKSVLFMSHKQCTNAEEKKKKKSAKDADT